MMPLITITSDFGDKDYYQSAVKARLRKIIPEAEVFDISHHISHFQPTHGANVFNAVFDDFEKKSIHFLSFNTLSMNDDSSPFYTLVECEEKFIIAPNNGTLSLLNRNLSTIRSLDLEPNSFPTLEIFIPVAREIIDSNYDISNIGHQIEQLSSYHQSEIRMIDDNMIKGNIVYIDSHGNLVTNISKELIDSKANGRRYTIKAGRRVILDRIQKNYGYNSTKDGGEAVAIFNHQNKLEISNAYGNAESLFGLDFNSPILITFSNS